MFLDKEGFPCFIDIQGRLHHIIKLNNIIGIEANRMTYYSYENIIKHEKKSRNNPWPNRFVVKVFENEYGLFNNDYIEVSILGLVKNSKEFKDMCTMFHPHLLI